MSRDLRCCSLPYLETVFLMDSGARQLVGPCLLHSLVLGQHCAWPDSALDVLGI